MVSPRKSTSALSLIPEENCRMMPSSSTKSCESLYSNTSSSKGSATLLYRRKTPPNGGNGRGFEGDGSRRHATLIPATTEVRQRVLSARRLRMKTYQNQLADAQQTIADLAHENRILRTLHKRQDSALAKYESTNAELPQLLHSHAEELRVWQTKYRNMQTINKELEHKLKQKETVVLSLSDQNKYYSQLNKDKNLDERQRLSEKLITLETRLQEKDNDMKLLARRLQLEAKNHKQQLHAEQKKTREVIGKLEKARVELSGYRKLDDMNITEKFNHMGLRRKAASHLDGSGLKLEHDLEKVVEEPELTPAEFSATEDTDYQSSHRSTHSNSHNNTGGGGVGRISEMSSTRTMRKLNVAAGKTQPQPLPPPKSMRRLDRGDGDAAVLGELKHENRISAKQQLQQKPPPKQSLEKHLTSTPEYEEDYENGGNETDDPAVTDDETKADADVEKIVDSQDEDDANDDDEDDEDDADADADDTETGTEPENEETVEEMDKVILNTTKTSTRMKEEISSIRKQISDDYKEREAFLDTFCRQATNSALRDDHGNPLAGGAAPTPQKRNSIALGHKVPPSSSRKHKLLAALKAIDHDNKNKNSQD